LETSIEMYRKGHEPGGSDPYPGLNALSLGEFLEETPPWRDVLFTEVRDALKEALDTGLERVPEGGLEIAKAKIPYWTHASLMEMSILVGDETTAQSAMAAALGRPHVAAQVETTLRNQNMIRMARTDKGQQTPAWVYSIMAALEDEIERLEKSEQRRTPGGTVGSASSRSTRVAALRPDSRR
jgi:hypothetical protein